MLNIHCQSNKSFSKLIFGIIYLSFIALLVASCDAPQEPKIDNPSDPLSTNPIPLPPINITIQSISKSSYQLSWQGQSRFETGYFIERYPSHRGADIPDTIYTTQQTLIENRVDLSIFYYQIHAMAQSRVGISSAKIKVIYSEGKIDSLPGTDVDKVMFDPQSNFIINYDGTFSTFYIRPLSNYKLLNSSNNNINLNIYVSGFTINPQGNLLAIANSKGPATSNNSVQIWKILDHSVLYKYDGYSSSILQFSPDGKNLAFVNNETDLEICNIIDGTMNKVVSLYPIKFKLMTYSPDGQFLIALCSDNRIRYFNTGQNFSLNKSFTCPPFGIALAVSSDGQILAGNFNATLMFWQTFDPSISSTISLPATSKDMFFIPGTHKLTIGYPGIYYGLGIFIVDADKAIIDRTIMMPMNTFTSYALSPNGKYFALAGSGSVYFWSAGDPWWIIPF